MVQFNPTLFIGIGEFNHFFTLRETYMHVSYDRYQRPSYEVRSFHHCNLSQNFTEAKEKAKNYSQNMGTPLRVREDAEEQLREIKRIDAETAEQNRLLAEERYAQDQAKLEAQRAESWKRFKLDAKCRLECLTDHSDFIEHALDLTLEAGKITEAEHAERVREIHENPVLKPSDCEYRFPQMVGGKHDGRPLASIAVSYLQWLVYESGLCEIDAEISRNRMAHVAQWIRDNMNVPEKAEVNNEWIGEVGEKIELELSIEAVRTFSGQYGVTFMYQMTDIEGHSIIWYASKEALADCGNNVRLKATIKKHDTYNGVKQTHITRAKVI